MYSARIKNSDYFWRKRVVENCIAEVKNRFLVLCNTNKRIAAIYEHASFLVQGERYGFDPDYDSAFEFLKKAANLGHSEVHIDLSQIIILSQIIDLSQILRGEY